MSGNETHGPAGTLPARGRGALAESTGATWRPVDEGGPAEEDDATRDWDNEGGHERGHERGHVAHHPRATDHDPARPPDPEALRVTGVLASALPPELGTPHEPVTYTVPAVFSRQVTREEQDAIEGDAVRHRLADAGFEDVELTVSDRRLLIEHTSLAALKGGLAHEVADVLRDLGRDLVAEHDRLAAEIAELQKEEDRRAAVVLVEAEQIRFE
ncbi:hypothetical protein ACFRCR_02180 [Oerskovia sp. NPDC056781]|uniref:hypothetical protein n=1 Tax=Oerskovia sp. NPDC056781 TaxID=3345942 RepID=UPI00366D186C